MILHSDLDNFYASVEEKKRPGLKGRPLVVCGNKEDRHGVVLAKNAPAKRAGIKTGDVLWQAKKKCKNLIEVPADFSEYLRVSKRVRDLRTLYRPRGGVRHRRVLAGRNGERPPVRQRDAYRGRHPRGDRGGNRHHGERGGELEQDLRKARFGYRQAGRRRRDHV